MCRRAVRCKRGQVNYKGENMAFFNSLAPYAEYILVGSILGIVLGFRFKKNLISSAGTLGTVLALSLIFSGGGFLPSTGDGMGDISGNAGMAGTAQDRNQEEPATGLIRPEGDASVTAGTDALEQEAENEDYISEEAAAQPEENTIQIRITQDRIYFNGEQASGGENLQELLEEAYADGMEIYLQDDYAVNETYEDVKNILDEFAAEYYETVLK